MNYFKSKLFSPLRALEVGAAKGAPYEYEPFTQPRSLRLLKLPFLPGKPCSIVMSPIDSVRPYTALSYTWGPPLDTDECKAEYADSKVPFEIQTTHGVRYIEIDRNLYESIVCITAKRMAEFIWIDAICINQADTDERSSQVPLMGEIYSRCEKVVVWLGRDESNLRDMISLHFESIGPKLMDFVDVYGPEAVFWPDWSSVTTMSRLGIDIRQEKWSSYVAFCEQHRWFSRAWVVQEVALAKEIEVLCNLTSISWNVLCAFGMWLSASLGAELRSFRVQRPTLVVGYEFTLLGRLRQFCADGGPAKTSFLSMPSLAERTGAITRLQLDYAFLECCLGQIRLCDATDPRDKIYAVLGIFSKFHAGDLDPLLIADYKLTEQGVYTRVTWVLLRELPCFSVLSMVADPSTSRLPDLPSWVPDFSFRITDNSFPALIGKGFLNASLAKHEEPAYRAFSGDFSGAARLHLDGAPFELVGSLCDPFEFSFGIGEEALSCQIIVVFQSLFRLCLTPNLIYQRGEMVYEAIWQTLIANATCCEPAPPISSSYFRVYLLMILATAVYHGLEDHPSFKGCMDYMDALEGTDASMFPKMDEIQQVALTLLTGQLNERFEEIVNIHRIMSNRIGLFNLYRRMYRTSGGHLGLGPLSMQPGDQIWIVSGAKVLFVFRETDEENTFRLIGETYLHGFMHGQAMTPEIRDRISPFTLV